MTVVAADANAPAHVPVVLDLIRPFTEHDDARLRGNAVIALTALIDGGGAELRSPARDELVEVLCADPGGRDLEWQRRFTAVSIDAIRQLKPEDSEAIRAKVLQNLAGSREPAQQAAIARLVLAACDQGRRLWPANWMQFRRYAGLAGRLTYLQCAWAAVWRSAIAFAAVLFGASTIEMLTDGRISDDVWSQCFGLGFASTFFLAIIMKLSIPGRLRPTPNVYLVDIALNAIVFGLFSVIGLAALRELSEEKFELAGPGMFVILLLGMAIGAVVRWLRWVNARSAIEPDGASHMIRPAAVLGLSAWACILLANLWPAPDIVAAAFLVIVPTASVLAALDVWLEEKGPRTQLPLESRNERRWLLPLVAAASVITAATFLTLNLKPQYVISQAKLSPVVAPQTSGDGTIRVPLPVGTEIGMRVEKDGLYAINAVSDRQGLRVWPQVRRGTEDSNLMPSQYEETIILFEGDYRACATTEPYSYSCRGVYPDTLIDHLVLAFGKLDTSASGTLTIRYIRTLLSQERQPPAQ